MFAKRTERRLKIIRAHVIGRRVDEIAREQNTGKLPFDIHGIGITGNRKPCIPWFFGFVFGE